MSYRSYFCSTTWGILVLSIGVFYSYLMTVFLSPLGNYSDGILFSPGVFYSSPMIVFRGCATHYCNLFQVQINGRNEIEVLMNGDLVEFDEGLMMDFNGVIVLKYNNISKYSTIFDSGISVTTEKVEDILQMMLLVPPIFKGRYIFIYFVIDLPSKLFF